jgi:hypothetical protein
LFPTGQIYKNGRYILGLSEVRTTKNMMLVQRCANKNCFSSKKRKKTPHFVALRFCESHGGNASRQESFQKIQKVTELKISTELKKMKFGSFNSYSGSLKFGSFNSYSGSLKFGSFNSYSGSFIYTWFTKMVQAYFVVSSNHIFEAHLFVLPNIRVP